MVNPKIKIKTGDTVSVLRGRDRGKSGKVLSVIPQDERAIVEGINMVYKHIRPRRAGEKGQRVRVASGTRISNLMVICPKCKKASRLGIKREGGIAQRVCKKCEAVIE